MKVGITDSWEEELDDELHFSAQIVDEKEGDAEVEDESDSPPPLAGIPFARPRPENSNSGIRPPAASVLTSGTFRSAKSGQQPAPATRRTTARPRRRWHDDFVPQQSMPGTYRSSLSPVFDADVPISPATTTTTTPPRRRWQDDFVPRQSMPGTYRSSLSPVFDTDVPIPSATASSPPASSETTVPPTASAPSTSSSTIFRAFFSKKLGIFGQFASLANEDTASSSNTDRMSGPQRSVPISPPTPTPTFMAHAREISPSYEAKKLRNVKAALREAALQRLAGRDDSRQERRKKGTTQYSFTASSTTKNTSNAKKGSRRFSPYPRATSPRAGAKTRSPPFQPPRNIGSPRSTNRGHADADQRRKAPAGSGSEADSRPSSGGGPHSFGGTSSHGGTSRFGTSSAPSYGPNPPRQRFNKTPGPQGAKTRSQATGSQSHLKGSSTIPADGTKRSSHKTPQLGMYDFQWSRLRSSNPPAELIGALGLADFPWPCNGGDMPTADNLEKFFFGRSLGADLKGEDRSFLNKQFRPWHTDKFTKMKKFVRPSEWARVVERQRLVINAFTDLINRGKDAELVG